MANTLSTIETPNLSLARIVYHTNLQRADSRPIALGVMAEITGGGCRGLGLIARTELLPGEMERVGRLIRDKLVAPFDYLKTEFEWAAGATRYGEALPALARRHTESLFFSPPTSKKWSKASRSYADLRAHLLSKLIEYCESEFWHLLGESGLELKDAKTVRAEQRLAA
ncbi:MAG: hypothetical protein ACLQAR_08945 [Steroidobacteraceae bacterium]